MSSLKLQKRLAADVMKCGKKKVKYFLFLMENLSINISSMMIKSDPEIL